MISCDVRVGKKREWAGVAHPPLVVRGLVFYICVYNRPRRKLAVDSIESTKGRAPSVTRQDRKPYAASGSMRTCNASFYPTIRNTSPLRLPLMMNPRPGLAKPSIRWFRHRRSVMLDVLGGLDEASECPAVTIKTHRDHCISCACHEMSLALAWGLRSKCCFSTPDSTACLEDRARAWNASSHLSAFSTLLEVVIHARAKYSRSQFRPVLAAAGPAHPLRFDHRDDVRIAYSSALSPKNSFGPPVLGCGVRKGQSPSRAVVHAGTLACSEEVVHGTCTRMRPHSIAVSFVSGIYNNGVGVRPSRTTHTARSWRNWT